MHRAAIFAFLGSLCIHLMIAGGFFYGMKEEIQSDVSGNGEQVVSFSLGMMAKALPKHSVVAKTVTPMIPQKEKISTSTVKEVKHPLPPQKTAKLVYHNIPKPLKKRKKTGIDSKKSRLKSIPKQKTKVIANTSAVQLSSGLGESQEASTNTSQHQVKQGKNNQFRLYRAGLQQAIARIAHRYYPRSAKRRREQGSVIVGFHLEKNGRISDIYLVRTSGIQRLDTAAQKALKRLSQYQAPPLGFPTKISVPISYRLK